MVCVHACVCVWWFVIDTVRQLSERNVVFMHNCIKQDSPLETIQLISHSVIFIFPISVTLCVCVCVCVCAHVCMGAQLLRPPGDNHDYNYVLVSVSFCTGSDKQV